MEEASDVSFPRIMRKTDDKEEDDWDITLNIDRRLEEQPTTSGDITIISETAH
jgi:hypothetical protein